MGGYKKGEVMGAGVDTQENEKEHQSRIWIVQDTQLEIDA